MILIIIFGNRIVQSVQCQGYGLMIRGSIPNSGKRLPVLQILQTDSKTHPATYSIENEVYIRRGKWQGREINHSPPSSAEFKIKWSFTSTSLVRLHGVHKDKLTFICF